MDAEISHQPLRSTAGATRTGVTLVAIARPSRTPPSTVLPSVLALASNSNATSVNATATTSTCAFCPHSRMTVGHQAQSAASLGSLPSQRSPNSRITVTSTAKLAAAAWMGMAESSAGATSCTAKKYASATGGYTVGTRIRFSFEQPAITLSAGSVV